MLVLLTLWLGPLPQMSATSFTSHMVLHLGVAVVSAPLLGIGLVRAGLARWATRSPVVLALVASLLEMLVVWSWHAPVLHAAASVDNGVFALQQLSFLGAGTLIWLVSFAGQSKLSAGAGALAMLMTFMHMTMLGVLLALMPDLLYDAGLYQGESLAERLADQGYGGVLMAIGGSLPYLAGGLILAHRLIAD